MKVSINTRARYSGPQHSGPQPIVQEVEWFINLLFLIDERIRKVAEWVEIVQVRFLPNESGSDWVASLRVVMTEPGSDSKIETEYYRLTRGNLTSEGCVLAACDVEKQIKRALQDRGKEHLDKLNRLNVVAAALARQ